MGVDVETTSYLRIYDGEGCQLYPDITIDRCNEEMFTYYQINPTQFSPDWCAQFSGDSGPCVKWNYEWETDLITLEFSTSASEADVIARYVYVSGPDTSDQTFYRPSSSAGSSDIVFWVVVEDNETLVKAKDGSNYYEDVFANGYVLPYDLSYYCQDTTSSPCPTGSITHIGYFLSPVAYVPSSTSGRTFTFAAEGTARVFEEWTTTWDIPNLTLRFPQGRKLIVEGELEADGVTFTEAASEQGWGGVAVYSGGTLDFDGVTVSDAEVGVDVYSTGNTFTNSFFTGNGVGIRSAYEQNYCPGLEACLIGDRSSFTLDQSCVTGSEYDPIDGLDYGYGVWARGTDALITATTVEGNDAYGLRLDDADVAARRLLLTENGTGSMFFPDGARALSNGDLTLASYFEGFPDRGGVALGLNSIRDNEDHEISLQDGYTTVGLVCSLTFCPDANRISESDFPGDFSLLIDNDTKEIIQAYRTYWATTPADPPDAASGLEVRQRDGWRVAGVLALLFLAGGSVDVSMKAFDELYGATSSQALFLLVVFGVAFGIGLALVVRRGVRDGVWPGRAEVGLGALLGVVNYGTAEFILQAIARLSGPFVFPANNIALVVGAAVLGVVVWGERLSATNKLGLGLAAGALLLLGL